MSRLSLSDADKDARDWLVETTESLGCRTTVDQMGNIFAVRPGRRNDGPPTFAGSHLDTQPTGGRYDGILGMTAAVEMLRVLNENWVETEYPVGVVNWTKYTPRGSLCRTYSAEQTADDTTTQRRRRPLPYLDGIIGCMERRHLPISRARPPGSRWRHCNYEV